MDQLNAVVEPADKLRGKKHEVWEDSFVPIAIGRKDCRSHFFMNQKLDYMHGNPCTSKWNLALSPGEYLHSSARFYIYGEQGVYIVTNVNELDDVDLTKKIAHK